MRFKDKVVLVTGSSRGIGKACALLFAKEGAKVVVNCSKSMEKAEKVVEEIKALGSDAIAVQCDVGNEEQIKSMINQTIEKFGKLDILVNNAGIVFDVPALDKTVEEWRKTLDVNLIGTFLCCKYAAEHLKKSGSGRIINISSTNGIDSFSPDAMDYDASKAGIVIMTRGLAKELAPEILVNSIAPGWVDTEMNAELPADFIQEEKNKIYLKRWADPEEIGKAVLFLASEDASFITGSILKVDGGYS